ncbi:MAG: 4-hydroxy-tetrahydrodipicolinate reductase [Proteobacteria bacterium]|nr:4-hydroxy-tetrahydrodipicolinate reductase [Pseudomonadota bacterium]
MTNPVKIGLVGAAGRMGNEIIRVIAARNDVVLSSAAEDSASGHLGADAGDVARVGTCGVAISDDLAQVAQQCDVLIDVSLAKAAPQVIAAAREARRPLVSGTTGISEAAMAQMLAAARDIPVLHTRNFSVGVTVLAELVRRAVQMLGADFDVEILEMHHRNKIDAPSGTAGMLADAATEGMNAYAAKTAVVNGRSGVTGVRPSGEIGVHALRGGTVVGDHTVILAGANERIELTHRSERRAMLAEGAVRCAAFLASQPAGHYTMAHVLGLADDDA